MPNCELRDDGPGRHGTRLRVPADLSRTVTGPDSPSVAHGVAGTRSTARAYCMIRANTGAASWPPEMLPF